MERETGQKRQREKKREEPQNLQKRRLIEAFNQFQIETKIQENEKEEIEIPSFPEVTNLDSHMRDFNEEPAITHYNHSKEKQSKSDKERSSC